MAGTAHPSELGYAVPDRRPGRWRRWLADDHRSRRRPPRGRPAAAAGRRHRRAGPHATCRRQQPPPDTEPVPQTVNAVREPRVDRRVRADGGRADAGAGAGAGRWRWRTRCSRWSPTKTGYPADMLDLDLDLEADLGIDTVKQAEVFATIRERYGIERDDKLKLRDYPTLAHVIGFVHDRAPATATAAPTTRRAGRRRSPRPSRRGAGAGRRRTWTWRTRCSPWSPTRPATRPTCSTSTSTSRPISASTRSSRPRCSPPSASATASNATTSSSCATTRPSPTSSASSTTAPRPRRPRRDGRGAAPDAVAAAEPAAPVPSAGRGRGGRGARPGRRQDRLPGRHARPRPRPRSRPRHRHGQAGRGVRHHPRALRHRTRRQAQAPRLPDPRPRHRLRPRPRPGHRRGRPDGRARRPRRPSRRGRPVDVADLPTRTGSRGACRSPTIRPPLAACAPTGVDARRRARESWSAPTTAGSVPPSPSSLTERGVEVLTIDEAPDADDARRRIDRLARARVRSTASTGCTALDDEGAIENMDLAGWREATRVRVKLLYATMRRLYDADRAAGNVPRGRRPGSAAATATTRRARVAPLGGAVTGFAKAFALRAARRAR